MIPAARRASILDLVRSRGAASITELEELLDVSPATIRRDLDILSRQNLLLRSHGGAVVEEVLSTTLEPEHTLQHLSMRPEKERIGTAALSLIENGQSIILDSSSTVLELARAIRDTYRNLTVVTNDVNIARELADSTSVAELVVTGGTLRKHHYSLGGSTVAQTIGRLHVDAAFLGVHALDRDGASETNLDVAHIKSLMARSAKRTFVLADHCKFGKRTFAPIVSLNEIDLVVTDDGVDSAIAADLRDRGVEILVT